MVKLWNGAQFNWNFFFLLFIYYLLPKRVVRAIVCFHANDLKWMNVLSYGCRMDATKNHPKPNADSSSSMDEFYASSVYVCAPCNQFMALFIGMRRSGGGCFFLSDWCQFGYFKYTGFRLRCVASKAYTIDGVCTGRLDIVLTVCCFIAYLCCVFARTLTPCWNVVHFTGI